MALLQHLAEKLPVSRLQRELSDSSALRNSGLALGHSLVAVEAARRGLGRLAVDEAAAARDLEGAWEVLGEAVQVVMRRHGLPDSYEQLKDLSRGRPLTRDMRHQFINDVALPADARDYLLALTPQTLRRHRRQLEPPRSLTIVRLCSSLAFSRQRTSRKSGSA